MEMVVQPRALHSPWGEKAGLDASRGGEGSARRISWVTGERKKEGYHPSHPYPRVWICRTAALVRAPGVRGPEERGWAAAPAPARAQERVPPVAVGFWGTGGRFPTGTCFIAQTPFGWVGGAAALPRPRGGDVTARGEAPGLAHRPLGPRCPSCPATTAPARPCPPCLSCFSCLTCPLGLAALQPLKPALLIAGRELIYICWRLHPLTGRPFHL